MGSKGTGRKGGLPERVRGKKIKSLLLEWIRRLNALGEDQSGSPGEAREVDEKPLLNKLLRKPTLFRVQVKPQRGFPLDR